MTAAQADGSVGYFGPDMNRFVWWANLTPARGDKAE